MLYAESGVGKSSLLRAGVAQRLRQLAPPALRASGRGVDVPVVFSSWQDDPVDELIARSTWPSSRSWPGQARHRAAPATLRRRSRQRRTRPGGTLLIILDQFEEYFLYSAREPEPERASRPSSPAASTDPGFAANFLISIREDAYAGLG